MGKDRLPWRPFAAHGLSCVTVDTFRGFHTGGVGRGRQAWEKLQSINVNQSIDRPQRLLPDSAVELLGSHGSKFSHFAPWADGTSSQPLDSAHFLPKFNCAKVGIIKRIWSTQPAAWTWRNTHSNSSHWTSATPAFSAQLRPLCSGSGGQRTGHVLPALFRGKIAVRFWGG